MKLPLNVALWFSGFVLSKFDQVCRRSLHASVRYCAARGTKVSCNALLTPALTVGFVVFDHAWWHLLTSAYSHIFAKTTARGMVDSITKSTDPKMIIAVILHACPSYIRIIIRGYKILQEYGVGEWRRFARVGRVFFISPHLLPYLLLRIYNHLHGFVWK